MQNSKNIEIWDYTKHMLISTKLQIASTFEALGVVERSITYRWKALLIDKKMKETRFMAWKSCLHLQKLSWKFGEILSSKLCCNPAHANFAHFFILLFAYSESSWSQLSGRWALFSMKINIFCARGENMSKSILLIGYISKISTHECAHYETKRQT